jgi:outer membrane lipoprotein-sorting protein
MCHMSNLIRRPLVRWFVPVVSAVVLLGGGWTVNQISASAQEGLPSRTAAQLLVDVQNARVDGLSGTIVQRTDLGLPSLPGGSGSSDLTSLVSGSHTLRVWFSGPDKARLALLGTFGESDVIVNGSDLWTWSSRGRVASHRTISLGHGHQAADGMTAPGSAGLPTTPQQAAAKALKAINPSTQVETSGTAVVAGRSAYELILRPRDTASLVGQVRIAIDGQTHIPLRVQVLARGSSTPAFETEFTSFDPTRPDAAEFTFNPPPGTKMTKPGSPSAPGGTHRQIHGSGSAPSAPTLVGKGWTTVVVGQVPGGAAGAGAGLPGQLDEMLQALPKVSGPWGSGRLLSGSLFSVVLTDDGRYAVGAVAPQALYKALAAR